MRVRAGIITGLHLQSFDLFVQGSELYSSIGTFQSSASARTSDLPTNIPNSCTNVLIHVLIVLNCTYHVLSYPIFVCSL